MSALHHDVWQTYRYLQGCFDCVRGCHNKHYWSISKGKDWNDIIMPNHKDSTMKLEFSWKPGMLSLDDLIK
jgi:hypothetical protein